MREGDCGLIPGFCAVCRCRFWTSKTHEPLQMDGVPVCWECFARAHVGGREVRAVYFDLRGCDFAAYCFDDAAGRMRWFVELGGGSLMIDREVFDARFLKGA